MIRPLTTANVDAFIHQRTRCLQQEVFSFSSGPNIIIDRDKTLKDFENKNEENFILGKFINSELVGIVGAIRHEKIKRRHRAWIWGMYVEPESRGNGYSKELLTTAIQKLRALEGLEKIELSVTSLSLAAHQLYTKLGFREYGRQKNAIQWQDKRIDEIFMELAF